MNAPIKLQAARLKLISQRPYLATALLALIPVAKPGIETLAVDEFWRLYFDPQIKWGVDEIMGVLYHEVLHLLRDHPNRMRNFEPLLSNIAADAEVNDDIIEEEVMLPVDPITPQMLGQRPGLLAEEYYKNLLKKKGEKRTAPKKGRESSCSNNEGGTPGSEDGGTVGLQSTAPSNPSQLVPSTDVGNPVSDGSIADFIESLRDSFSGQSSFQSWDKPAPGEGNCGSCATGVPASWEDPSSQIEKIGRVEAEIIRHTVAEKIKEHVNSQGKIPAHLKRWAEDKLEPKINWRRVLAKYIRSAVAYQSGAVDYTYSKPSRRQSKDYILPRLQQPVINPVVIIDTSGSISDEMLSQALGETRSILRSIGCKKLTVLTVDEEVQSTQHVYRASQIKLEGGGGTDMGIGITAALKFKPSVIIVITDGLTPWPDRKPPVRVIAALLGNQITPSWVKRVEIYRR